jgi:hypothetical protein
MFINSAVGTQSHLIIYKLSRIVLSTMVEMSLCNKEHMTFFLLFICAYIVWAISPSCHPIPSSTHMACKAENTYYLTLYRNNFSTLT